MLIQDLHGSTGIDRSSWINGERGHEWNRRIARLPKIGYVKNPHYYFPGSTFVNDETIQLRVIIDVSQNAYGTAA